MNYGDAIRAHHLKSRSEAIEVVASRGETYKTFDNQDGTFTRVISTGAVHYKENYEDSREQWKDIDTTPIDKGDHFLIEKSPLIVKTYKDKIGYEVTARKSGHKFTVELERIGNLANLPQLVTPVVEESKVKFKGILSDLLDFEIDANHARVRIWKHLKNNNSPKTFRWKVTEENKKTGLYSLSFRESPEVLDLEELEPWGLPKAVKVQTKKTTIDSKSFYWEETAPKGKVKIDTDVSYYSGVGDGNVSESVGTASQEAWDTLHDASSGSSVTYTDYTVLLGAMQWSPYLMIISRGFFPFDTSELPDDASISSATFSIVGYAGVYGAEGTKKSYGLVQTSQASTSSLVGDDYDQCGAINSPTEGASRFTKPSDGVRREVPLNSTGLTWISKTGYTKLGVRGEVDLDDYYDGLEGEYGLWYASEQSGTDYDPMLAITYTAGGPTPKSVSDSASGNDSLSVGKKVSLQDSNLANVTTF